VVKDLYRTVRPFSVKHGPGKSLLNDPVTVFFVCAEVEVSARPVRDKKDCPPYEPDPVDQGIRMTRGKDFPTHCRGLVINIPPWFCCPVFHGVTPLQNVQSRMVKIRMEMDAIERIREGREFVEDFVN
jgi:hypothetical protein